MKSSTSAHAQEDKQIMENITKQPVLSYKTRLNPSQDSYWLRKYVSVERPTHEIAQSTQKIGQFLCVEAQFSKISVCVAFVSR
jgi:hypothetical protein